MYYFILLVICAFNVYLLDRFYGVMVSTLDFESVDPSSNLGRTYIFYQRKIKMMLLQLYTFIMNSEVMLLIFLEICIIYVKSLVCLTIYYIIY